MPFRFRRSARLGPLRFHFSSKGLSSISLGGRGASLNIPVARSGAARTTVGLPGTGLSWTAEHGTRTAARPGVVAETGLPNSRRLRAGQLEVFKQNCLAALSAHLFAPGGGGHRLWELQAISRLLAGGGLSAREVGLLALIETPEAMQAYVLRAQSQDDAKRRAKRCIEAAQLAARLLQRAELRASGLSG